MEPASYLSMIFLLVTVGKNSIMKIKYKTFQMKLPDHEEFIEQSGQSQHNYHIDKLLSKKILIFIHHSGHN